MRTAEVVTGLANPEKKTSDKSKPKRLFYDAVFLVAFLCCLTPGAIPSISSIASIVLALCIMICFFDENFYLYAALFMFMRYRMLLGDSPVFRIYSYLVVIKFIIDITKTRFRLTYLPALIVFFLHCVFATPRVEGWRLALNVIVDVSLIYLILLQVTAKPELMRKYLFVMLMGCVASGVYGWTYDGVSVDISIRGAGAHQVTRNFGALGDSNIAGFFYAICTVLPLILKNIPKLLKAVFSGIAIILLLQTASLSGILLLCAISSFLIILKYRWKSIFILGISLIAIVIALVLLLSIPQFRQIDAIAGLIIRIEEKLSYIPRGRWDLLTTDRSALWAESLALFFSKSTWGKLFGGSVITIMVSELGLSALACHNSIIQCLLNFGLLGTLAIYLPFLAVFVFRLFVHFSKKPGYENEDIKTAQLLFQFAFLFFGLTVDFFIDWAYMLFYFI